MGDVRFNRAYEQLLEATNRAAALHGLSDEEVVGALAAVATHESDPYLANVLATEAQNRVHRAAIVTDSLGEGVCVVDAKGRVTLVNPAAERLLGWASDDLLGRDLHEMTHARRPDGSPRARDECGILEPLGERPVCVTGETDLVRRDGSFLPVEWTSSPLHQENETVGVVVIFRDVTELKRRERQLARRAAELEAVVHSIHDAVYIGDETGIKMANPAALEMLGFRSLDELNHRISELSVRLNNRNPETGEKVPPSEEPFARALAGESVVENILSTNLLTGEDVLLRCAAAPIRLDGEILGAVAVNTPLDEYARPIAEGSSSGRAES